MSKQICPRCERVVPDNEFIWEDCAQCQIDDAARAHRYYRRHSYGRWWASAAVVAILAVFWWIGR